MKRGEIAAQTRLQAGDPASRERSGDLVSLRDSETLLRSNLVEQLNWTQLTSGVFSHIDPFVWCPTVS